MGRVSTKRLFRYTSIASTLDILRGRRLTLLSPSLWQDRNDAEYILAYKSAKKLRDVYALCFTEAFETSQHWSLFTNNMDGVRIEFDRESLEADVSKIKEARLQPIIYKKIQEVHEDARRVDNWPFLKRLPYKGECEVRIIFEYASDGDEPPVIPIRKSTIKKLFLSPAIPKALQPAIVATFRDVWGSKIEVSRSTLFENQNWLRPVREKTKRIKGKQAREHLRETILQHRSKKH